MFRYYSPGCTNGVTGEPQLTAPCFKRADDLPILFRHFVASFKPREMTGTPCPKKRAIALNAFFFATLVRIGQRVCS